MSRVAEYYTTSQPTHSTKGSELKAKKKEVRKSEKRERERKKERKRKGGKQRENENNTSKMKESINTTTFIILGKVFFFFFETSAFCLGGIESTEEIRIRTFVENHIKKPLGKKKTW